MQGQLTDLPLLSLLDLIHASSQTGVLEVENEVPFTVAFMHGEVVAGGILDWLGPEALQSAPLLAQEGKFNFEAKAVTGTPLGPYQHFMAEWARIGDEWEEVCQVIGSPSNVFMGDLPLFDELGGRSIRAAARKTGKPIFEVAQAVAEALQHNRLSAMNRYAWFGLLLRPQGSHDPKHPITHLLDGNRNLGEVVANGQTVEAVRQYLLKAIQRGLRFPGSGWVLRDLIWETQYAKPME